MTLFASYDDTSSEVEIRDLFSDIKSRFTLDQKKAVMASLMRVADSDREFHEFEEQQVRLTAAMLNYPLKEDKEAVRMELFETDTGEVLSALDTLDEDQKDWYIFTMASLIHADGKVLKEEIEYANIFLEHMQISKERFDLVIQQSEILTDYIP